MENTCGAECGERGEALVIVGEAGVRSLKEGWSMVNGVVTVVDEGLKCVGVSPFSSFAQEETPLWGG